MECPHCQKEVPMMSVGKIEKICSEIIVPEKEWLSMTEAQQSYIKGSNQASRFIIKQLVGKIGKQFIPATVDEIEKIILDELQHEDTISDLKVVSSINEVQLKVLTVALSKLIADKLVGSIGKEE